MSSHRIAQRWMGALAATLGLALPLLLAGCASQPEAGAAPQEWQTAADDSEARKRARTRLALATGYYEQGQFGVALEEFKRAAQADPSFGDVYNLGGLVYLALGDKALAETHFQRAIALNPRDADAMHNLGWVQCDTGRFAEAHAQFERAIAVPTYPGRARTLMVQGICEIRAGQPMQAEATLMRSYELDAGNPVTAYNLSSLLLRRGELARAQFYIRRLNNSELANAESLWLGIKVERRVGDQRAMEQLVSQLRRRFPQSRELQAYDRGSFDE